MVANVTIWHACGLRWHRSGQFILPPPLILLAFLPLLPASVHPRPPRCSRPAGSS